jgi:hypothetical protein
MLMEMAQPSPASPPIRAKEAAVSIVDRGSASSPRILALAAKSPTTQAACVLNGVSNACEYDSEGGVSANTYQGTKDVQTFKRLSGSICIDFSNGEPYSTDGTVVDVMTGGTGRFAKKTGPITTHVWGQMLSMDSAGNGFSWYRAEGTSSK